MAADPVEVFAGITGLEPEVVQRSWDMLGDEERAVLLWRARWLASRHRHQVEPAGLWHVWMMLAGRGAGKSRTGAEWAGWSAVMDPGSRTLVAAPTSGDLRDVCFEGNSGLLSVIPAPLVKNYSRSLHEMVLTNGSLLKGIPASEPERFRGPQWHRAWCDELAAWNHGGGEDEQAWDQIAFSVRLGERTQVFISTTPKPNRLVRGLIKRAKTESDVVVTRASTYDNLEHLSPTFKGQILQYEGTKIGRQEIHAEVIDPEEDGVVRRSQIRLWPADKPLPSLEVILMSLDTAFSEKHHDQRSGNDPSACSVWAGFRHEGKPGIMMLDCWEDRLGYPDLVARVKREVAVRYGDDELKPVVRPLYGPGRVGGIGKGIDFIVIEDKASGISLRQTLARDGIVAHPYNPGRADKLTRLHIVSPLFAQGYVWMVESEKRAGQVRSWAEPMVLQLCSYAGEGSIPNDDLLDTATQGLRVLNDRWLRTALLDPAKSPRSNVVELDSPIRRVNPYAV